MSKKLKVLGLALIVVCAFGAISASAQAVPKFTIEGGGSGAIRTTTVNTTSTNGGKLTLTVKGLLWITCSSVGVEGGSVTNGTDEGSATSLKFAGCSIDNTSGVAQPLCNVKSAGAAPVGTIETNALTATLVNVGGVGHVTFKPNTGTFVEVVVGGAECALAGTNKITGTAVAKIESPAAGTLATTVTLEASQAISEAAGDKLLYGQREAWLDGTIDLALASDANWGYDL
jgi:hypothetical protein